MGGSFVIKTWKLRNAGEKAWPEGTKEFALPPVQPGEEVTVSVPLQMPQKPGKIVSHFQLASADRTVFGPRFWAELQVGPAPERKQQETAPVLMDSLAPMRAAASSSSSSAPHTAPADEDDDEDSEDGMAEDASED